MQMRASHANLGQPLGPPRHAPAPPQAAPAPSASTVLRIDHIAFWTRNLERCKQFYAQYFGARLGENYRNPAKGFESCFLSFAGGARIELMSTTQLALTEAAPGAQRLGLTHLAISLGSVTQVDALTRRLKADGFPVLDGPRRTGDGYYESVVLDPDGNRLELTA